MRKGRKKFQSEYRIPPRDKGIWKQTINTRIPLITHSDIANYAIKNNLNFEQAHHRIIGIAFASLNAGFKVEYE